MMQKYKKLGIIVISVSIAVVILLMVANVIIENKIRTTLDKLPESVSVNYSDIDASAWRGDLKLMSPNVIITGETTNKVILNLRLNAVRIDNISYWDFIFNNKIDIGAIVFDELIAQYNHNARVSSSNYRSDLLAKIKNEINIDKISITQGDVLISNYENDSIILSVPEFNFELNSLKFNTENHQQHKGITYNRYELNAKNLEWALNDYEDLFLETIEVSDSIVVAKVLQLRTKYDRTELSSLLESERDHFIVTAEEVKIYDMDFGYANDRKFYFITDNVILNNVEAEIYRDKLVADDFTYKKLYSTLLRELDFNLGLRTVEFFNGKISYLEKTRPSESAGRLDFKSLNATIKNLGNTFGAENTSIEVNTLFMEDSPLEVDWSFKVADTTDQFSFKADLGFMDATQMVQFTKPNLNVGLNGELKQTYFTIDGNPRMSRIDLKVKYDNFEISILKKNGKEKNKFLSGLVNLFVSKDSEEDKKSYRYGQSDDVERDVTKSVFNFTWLNIKAGLFSAMAGDGEKED